MATKTFKIGLNNTDKQNMAQDVYERVLALSFEEYNSSSLYSVNDYVVENDLLYRCIVAVTTPEAFDSDKWVQATLNDVINSVNGAVESVANKAEVDGNYPTMTVGAAESIVSDREIDNPELSCPPITFGITGGEAEIQTGINKFEDMYGKSIKFNQLVKLRNVTVSGVTAVSDLTNHTTTFNGTMSSSNHIQFGESKTHYDGHKYFAKWKVSGTIDKNQALTWTFAQALSKVITAGTYDNEKMSLFFACTRTYGGYFQLIAVPDGSTFTDFVIKDLICIDLTEIFGAGNEPTSLEECEQLFPLDYYEYNAGSILSAKSASLISRGKNQFSGFNTFIRVVTGQEYELSGITAGSLVEYDASQNEIETHSLTGRTVLTMSDNTYYVKIAATTYSDIMFYLTFPEDGGVYNEPFEEYREQVVELPNIELRSVNDIKDVAYATGGGIRRVGVVDLGSLGWDWDSDKNEFVCYGLPKPLSRRNDGLNLLCIKYKTRQQWYYAALNNKEISTRSNYPYVYVRDDSFNGDKAAFKTAMSGVMLYYELDTPEEILTSENPGWAELVYTDNFGTIEFTTSPAQIPQVEQPYFIRYTVSLTEFLDTAYVHAGGDANNLVNKNELVDYAASKDGAYENLWAGNLITDTNWRWINDFKFGTGTVDTVFNGEATLYSIRGITEWNGTTPKYVNVVSNKSIIFNLYNPELGYAHVVESDEENNGLCVFGTEITSSNVIEFSTTSDFTSITEIALTEETNSTGETYLQFNVPSDGYVRVKNAEPEDLCIANVWGGNRVSYHPAYEESVIDINSATYFPTGMKGITVNGDNTACYDEIFANKFFARCLANTFGATPSVTYVAASGTYNIYRISLSNAMNKGACEIGGSSKFAWSDVGTMSSSTPLSADTMSLASGYIYFAIAQSEDTTYTYSEDATVVDAETFASELTAKGALYKLVDTEYVSVTEYEADTTYYYISATDLHGLNGKAITDEIANKTIVYQRYSMDKTVYAGTAISPAKNWTYKMGDFGTEELTLAEGFPVTPRWAVYYPVNVVETVQQLPNNYVSLESAEQMLHQVGELQGFDFDSISVDEETGNMKVNGLVDTKETIDISNINPSAYVDISITNRNKMRNLCATRTPFILKFQVNNGKTYFVNMDCFILDGGYMCEGMFTDLSNFAKKTIWFTQDRLFFN